MAIDSKTYQYYLKDLGELLKESALEAKKEAEKSKGLVDEEYKLGYQMAYYEVISLLQQQANAFGIPLQQLGLHDITESDLL